MFNEKVIPKTVNGSEVQCKLYSGQSLSSEYLVEPIHIALVFSMLGCGPAKSNP